MKAVKTLTSDTMSVWNRGFEIISNGDRRVGGKIGRSLIDRPPDRVQLLFQVFLKQTDVRAVNEQVGTHLQESRLLLNLSPEQGWSRGFQEPGRFRC
jgi:hypothetical protein